MLRCHVCARIVTVSRWKTTFGGSLGRKGATFGGARFVEENATGCNQTGFWWCRQAKVSIKPSSSKRTQYLCGNLINALKLLVNQQEDGDGLIQNIVTNFCEGSRRRLTKGLRVFILVDNHGALEVGHLSEGLGTFEVQRPKGSEGYPEVTVRESPDEMTLRAEEVRAWKSYINVDHTEKERWGPPPVDADWHAFCLALYKGIVGEDW